MALTREDRESLVALARQTHEETQGAPVQLEMSGFKVKIGPWLSHEMWDMLKPIIGLVGSYMSNKGAN